MGKESWCKQKVSLSDEQKISVKLRAMRDLHLALLKLMRSFCWPSKNFMSSSEMEILFENESKQKIKDPVFWALTLLRFVFF